MVILKKNLLHNIRFSLEYQHISMSMASGADIVWGKQPPSMGAKLRYELLEAVLQKRS